MNLIFPATGDNYGGVDRFWYAREEDIAGTDALGQIVLKEGAVWYFGKAVKYSIEFNNPSQSTRGGVVYQPRLSGVVKKYRPELETVLSAMRGEKFALIYKDKNGYLIQVGRPKELLTFTTDQETGGLPSDNNSFVWSFRGETTAKPVHRTLAIDADDSAPPQPVIGSPVNILLNGILVATIPPGGTFAISTEFTLEYDILP